VAEQLKINKNDIKNSSREQLEKQIEDLKGIVKKLINYNLQPWKECEICEQKNFFAKLIYQPNEKMKVFSSLESLKNNRQEKRYFCSTKCLKEWCEMPDNWK
jgi:hypothetical protein